MNKPLKMLRMSDVVAKLGMSRAAIYSKQNPKSRHYDATFPKGVKISGNVVAWVEAEIDEWLLARIQTSRIH